MYIGFDLGQIAQIDATVQPSDLSCDTNPPDRQHCQLVGVNASPVPFYTGAPAQWHRCGQTAHASQKRHSQLSIPFASPSAGTCTP